jgi:hypothetical protein
MHEYYISPKVDVRKVEDEAWWRSHDARHPEPSTIHYHPHGVPCGDHKHTHFPIAEPSWGAAAQEKRS